MLSRFSVFSLLTALFMVFALFTALSLRTWLTTYPDSGPTPQLSHGVEVDNAAALTHFQKALTFKTITYDENEANDWAPFLAMQAWLKKTYPLTFQNLQVSRISELSLLLHWRGQNSARPPFLLAAHQDVVPVQESEWTVSPFSGELKDGYIYGRGAIDDKASLVAILEATEALLKKGFKPSQDIYLAFGHNEEIGGMEGAQGIAQKLQKDGVLLEFVLDEGGAIRPADSFQSRRDVALIGIAEKGYANFRLTAHDKGGHSSKPTPNSAVVRLARAVQKIDEHPIPGKIRGATLQLFESMEPELPFLRRLVLQNLWLTQPLVLSALSANPATNATIRTTLSTTILQAGLKTNVIPSEATAIVNARLMPGTKVEEVLGHLMKVINDANVKVEVIAQGRPHEASLESKTDSKAYQRIRRAARAVTPDVLVSPYLVIGATDGRHYESVAENVYRYLPIRLDDNEILRFHGKDERLPKETFEKMIQFYLELISSSET